MLLFPSFLSNIINEPNIKNIVKVIYLVSILIYWSNKSPRIIPISGIIKWNIPIITANNNILLYLIFNVPIPKDKEKASILKLIATKMIANIISPNKYYVDTK